MTNHVSQWVNAHMVNRNHHMCELWKGRSFFSVLFLSFATFWITSTNVQTQQFVQTLTKIPQIISSNWLGRVLTCTVTVDSVPQNRCELSWERKGLFAMAKQASIWWQLRNLPLTPTLQINPHRTCKPPLSHELRRSLQLREKEKSWGVPKR